MAEKKEKRAFSCSTEVKFSKIMAHPPLLPKEQKKKEEKSLSLCFSHSIGLVAFPFALLWKKKEKKKRKKDSMKKASEKKVKNMKTAQKVL